MRIIISPAKKMNMDTDTLLAARLPRLLPKTEKILTWLGRLTLSEAKELWHCNEKLAELNFQRIQDMDLRHRLTPAILSYEGIQYQYMAPGVFTEEALSYVQEHLRILSGFYGCLAPLDGVTPYRLEMQAKADIDNTGNLYQFWGEDLYREVIDEGRVILNLASKEYSKCIETYVRSEDQFITCVFGEWKDGKVIQKGTQAKMARGEMVRYLAENCVESPEAVKKFTGLGYAYQKDLSTETEYVFLKQ